MCNPFYIVLVHIELTFLLTEKTMVTYYAAFSICNPFQFGYLRKCQIVNWRLVITSAVFLS